LEEGKLLENGWKKIQEGYEYYQTRILSENGIYRGYQGNAAFVLNALSLASINAKDREIETLFKADPKLYQAKILNLFKKIVHKKYQREFNQIYQLIQPVYQQEKEFQKIIVSACQRGVLSGLKKA